MKIAPARRHPFRNPHTPVPASQFKRSDCTHCIPEGSEAYTLPGSGTAPLPWQFSLRDGSHFMLTRYIRKRLRMPESYEHVGTCSCAEGWKLRILTTFKAKSYRGDASLIRLLAEMAPDGAILSVRSL